MDAKTERYLNLVAGIATQLMCTVGLDWENEVAIACNFSGDESEIIDRWHALHKKTFTEIKKALADSERAKRYRKALEEISNLDWGRAAVNGCAYSAVMLAKSALQEPPHAER